MKSRQRRSDPAGRAWARSWPQVETLFDALDRRLLQGEPPEHVLRIACEHICSSFGYPLLALRGFPAEGREAPLRFAAGELADKVDTSSMAQMNWAAWSRAGITSGVGLPIRVAGGAVASLCVFTRNTQGFSFPEVKVLATIGRRLAAVFVMSASQHQLRLLATALSSAINAVFITDTEGCIEWVNTGFTRMTGYAAQEVIGRNPRLLRSGMHDREFFRGVWETIKAGLPWEGEVTEQHKDGRLYIVHQTITPITGADGRVSHFVAIHEDITRSKRLEHELRESRDRALDAARLRSEFLANMSHEVRTPMNGVMGMLELLADTELSDEQRRYLEVAQRSARVLLDSLNDILDYSRMGAVGLTLHDADADLPALLDEVVEIAGRGAGEKDFELDVLFEEGAPQAVRLDAVRLRQVLLNLIGNAVKFTERGSVTVRVMARPTEPPSVRFEVSDTGIGIPADALERIFEPFQQADGSSTRRYGGNGLGLAISRQIVTAMGGAIGVRSQLGRGSTFWFTVCFSPPLNKSQPPRPLTGIRVLLVEARAQRQAAFMHLARTLGLEATVVEQGGDVQTALDRAEEEGHPFRAVLLAEVIPDVPADALYGQLKAQGHTPPVIMVAGRGQSRVTYGDFLQRPMSGRQLERALRIALDGVGDPSSDDAGARHRILVAEDSAVNQQVVVSMLSRLGLDYVLVQNGQEALDYAERVRFDAVLMDCQMPRMDGYEAARRMRRREGERGAAPVPIIAMTAHGRDDEPDRYAAAGMDDYLPKPLELDRLQRVLARFLNHPSLGAASPLDNDVLDGRALAQLRDVGAQDAAHIVETFLDDTPMRLEELRLAIGQCNWLEAARLAHTLKGSGTALGVRELVRNCAELETRCKAGGKGASDVLNAADHAFHIAHQPLRSFRAALLERRAAEGP